MLGLDHREPFGRLRTLRGVRVTEEPSEDVDWGRARQGDGEAFGRIFDCHQERVYRHALRLTADPHEAEDATAMAFLELWRRRADVRVVSGSVLAWLLVTTTNIVRNAVRARRRYQNFLATLPREHNAPDVAELAFGTLLSGGDQQLAAALRALPPMEAQMVSLVLLDDLALGDAAEVLGTSPGAAKSRLHRARVRLRAALGDDHRMVTGTVKEAER